MRLRGSHLFLIVIAVNGIASWGYAQQNPIFPGNELISTGVYYYPEHWPEEQWERDFRRMAELGFEFTHFGEFAWAFLEPEEGKFEFGWLDKAIGLADKYGLNVILCTPTPTPPAWLSDKHPEILIRNSEGHRAVHGTRQHASWSSATYRYYVGRIVTKLAERYGDDPRIVGWQLDNEPSHYGWTEDYSFAARENFQVWLQNKYGTIENLNNRWGLAFWSEKYNTFDQVAIPNESLSPINFVNQHAYLDWKRFSADEAADFLNFQTEILRDHIRDQWITTNYMSGYHAVDPWRSDFLDFITWTSYPVSGYSQGIGEEGFRRGDPFSIGFANDRFRPYKGKTGVMELQVSQVSWGNYNARLYPGIRKVFLYHVLAGGNSFASFYRYRQPTFNYEQNILGIVGTDGTELTDGGEEIVAFIQEIERLRTEVHEGDKEVPEVFEARKTAVLWDNDQLWITGHQQQTLQWNYMSVVKGYYDILKSFGAPVDFVSEERDFKPYAAVVVPAYELVDKKLIRKWREYVEAGGHLILTCRTGVKDKNGHYWEAQRAAPIYGLIGAGIDFYDNLPAEKYASVRFENGSYQWNNWGEGLELNGAQPLAIHTDQFYQGTVAVSKNEIGDGTVTYIGIDTDDKKLERAVLQKVFADADIPIENYPDGVVVDWRDGLWIGVNYSDTPYEIEGTSGKKFLIGDRVLETADVAVWR